MAAVMSGAERSDYGAVIVVGGGCYGSYYVRQLQRARSAGAIELERITVVDHDEHCRVASECPDVDFRLAEWNDFFDDYLTAASRDSRDAIVPSPLMPHLMYEWLVRRARARWPRRDVCTRPLRAAPDTPWQSTAPDGTAYASFATWMCPINCIEPRICPHTRSTRDWTMPAAAEKLVARTSTDTDALTGPVIFHCTHRAYGVGMFDTRDVLAGDEFIARAAGTSEADVLVGTMSHCHGAFNVLHVGAETQIDTHG